MSDHAPERVAVDGLFHDEVARMERRLSFGRAAFCALIFARLTFVDGATNDRERLGLDGAVLIVAIGLSLALGLLARGPSRRRLARVSVASTALDTIACSGALLTNVLWPWSDYPGLFALPDPAALLLVVAIAGLRYSVRLSLLAGALASAAAFALATFDGLWNDRWARTDSVVIFGLYLAMATTLATWLAQRSRALALRSAEGSVRSERARRSLDLLLRDHHDVGSSLAAAQLGVELARSRRTDASELDGVLTALAEVRSYVERTRDLAHADLASLDAPASVQLRAVLDELAPVLALRFPGVALEVDVDADQAVSIAGGRPGLARVMLNLLTNAMEGDGAQGASHVVVRTRRVGSELRLEVVDDGPGLRVSPTSGATTKPRGRGLGTRFVRLVVEASGGQVRWRRREGCGTAVELALPAARRAGT